MTADWSNVFGTSITFSTDTEVILLSSFFSTDRNFFFFEKVNEVKALQKRKSFTSYKKGEIGEMMKTMMMHTRGTLMLVFS